MYSKIKIKINVQELFTSRFCLFVCWFGLLASICSFTDYPQELINLYTFIADDIQLKETDIWQSIAKKNKFRKHLETFQTMILPDILGIGYCGKCV